MNLPNKQDLINYAAGLIASSPAHIINKEIAINSNLIGMQMFEAPIMRVAAADDDMFCQFKQPTVIGDHFWLPREWLPEAQSVVAFFLPFTLTVKKSNRLDKSWPSNEWLHSRIEGQQMVNQFAVTIKSVLNDSGYQGVVPTLDSRFWSRMGIDKSDVGYRKCLSFTSNWSERHVAFVSGLGTFGLSKGLITHKGTAGRLVSVITDLYLTPDQRQYEGIDEYCSQCGACANRCPVKAISPDKGKDHQICSDYLDQTNIRYNPRYGCGKCQTGVPSESGIPKLGLPVYK